MNENIMIRINEDGTAEPYEPYTTVVCETKEDYDRFVELVELGKSIVRCKDCKHYQYGVYFTDIKFCCRLKDKEGKPARYNFSDDDFCSYGEPKGGEG